MTGLFILSALAVAILCTGLALAWLFRTLKWEVIEDEELHYRAAQPHARGWNRLKTWLKPRPRMLTYRRDRRGRFRRYRR